MSWTVEAVAEEASRIRHTAVGWVAARVAGGSHIDDVRLALSEALTNAVIHAYVGQVAGSITIELRVSAARCHLEAQVTDGGRGLVPREDSPGLGLGLPLMTQAADAIDFRDAPGGAGTQVAMTFVFDPVAHRACRAARR